MATRQPAGVEAERGDLGWEQLQKERSGLGPTEPRWERVEKGLVLTRFEGQQRQIDYLDLQT